MSRVKQIVKNFSTLYKYIVVQIIVAIFVEMFEIFYCFNNNTKEYLSDETKSFLIVAISGVITFGILHKRIKEIYGIGVISQISAVENKLKLKLLLYAVVIKYLPIIPLYIITLFNNELESASVVSKGSILLFIIVQAISICVIAPFAEEVLFRGVLLKDLSSVVSFRTANILQAVVFMLFHGDIITMVSTFILGYIQGILVKKYNSIGVAVIVHFWFNCIAFFLQLYDYLL